MTKRQQKEHILSDSPLFDPSEDNLGYGEFAEQLSRSITRMAPEDGFVMAIYGAWGSGKTTLLNFVRFYLDRQPRESKPLVIEFNPWWFSDDESLIRSFFNQLEAKLSRDGVQLERVRNALAKFAEVLSGLPSVPWYSSNSLIRRLVTLAFWLLQGRSKKVDVLELKELIADDLRNQQQRIVLIIDDIDRLTASEIRQLFRIIKAVGDFPYVTYLLAFDKEVVEAALTDSQQGMRGDQYLEKIVQVPVPLPSPETGSVHRMLTSRLDVLISDTPEQYWESERWALVYDPVTKLIRTPRDVVRLINLLQLTYPSMNGNVNPVDFIGINLISIVRPELYDLVRRSKDIFVGEIMTATDYGHREVERLKTFHERWRDAVPEQQRGAIQRLMEKLFPKLEAVFGNTHYSDEEWEAKLRICHRNVFDLYFRLALPVTEFVNTEMQAMIGAAATQREFEDRLRNLLTQKQLDGSTRLRRFLERLEAYTASEIPEERIPQMVQAFLNIGDELSPEEDEPRGMFEFDNEFRIVRLLHQLLRRLDPQKRFQILKEAVANGAALDLIAHELGIRGQELKKPDRAEGTITESQLKELQQIVLKKVREAAKQGTLGKAHNFSRILYQWKEWAEAEEPRQWALQLVATDPGLVQFLESFGTKGKSGQMETGLVSEYLRIDPKSIEPFVEPSSVVDRVRKIQDDETFSARQRKVARQFVKEYEMRERNLDPDNPLAEREMEKVSASASSN